MGELSLQQRLGRRCRLQWRYRNRQTEPVELWLSVPLGGPYQQIESVELSPEPLERSPGPDGLGELAFFRVAPGEMAEMKAIVQTLTGRLVPTRTKSATATALSIEDLAPFLRPTTLIPITPELEAEARSLTTGVTDPWGQVHRLFCHLVDHYKYKYPPKERGALSMRANRAGDCGEFSFLLAAWCRALGIPARVMVGTWAYGRFAAHVWNEVWIDGLGWIQVDGSYARVNWPPPLHRLLRRWRRLPEPGFSIANGRRIAFSVGCDRALIPEYRPVEKMPDKAWRLRMGGVDLPWGLGLLHGRAPYLQPCYIRFGGPTATLQTDDLMGSWSVTPAGIDGFLERVRPVSLVAGILLQLSSQSLPKHLPFQHLAFPLSLGAWLLWTTASIRRGEMPLLTVPLSILFGLSLVIWAFVRVHS